MVLTVELVKGKEHLLTEPDVVSSCTTLEAK